MLVTLSFSAIQIYCAFAKRKLFVDAPTYFEEDSMKVNGTGVMDEVVLIGNKVLTYEAYDDSDIRKKAFWDMMWACYRIDSSTPDEYEYVMKFWESLSRLKPIDDRASANARITAPYDEMSGGPWVGGRRCPFNRRIECYFNTVDSIYQIFDPDGLCQSYTRVEGDDVGGHSWDDIAGHNWSWLPQSPVAGQNSKRFGISMCPPGWLNKNHTLQQKLEKEPRGLEGTQIDDPNNVNQVTVPSTIHELAHSFLLFQNFPGNPETEPDQHLANKLRIVAKDNRPPSELKINPDSYGFFGTLIFLASHGWCLRITRSKTQYQDDPDFGIIHRCKVVYECSQASSMAQATPTAP